MKQLFILIMIFLLGLEITWAQGTATGVISYTETIALETSQTEVNHTWTEAFNDENYFLYVRAWHEEVIDGKTVQLQNAIYDFSKTNNGFSLKLKIPGGKLTYYAVEAGQVSGINLNKYQQSFTAAQGQTRFTLDNTPLEASVWFNGLLQFDREWSIDGNDIVLTFEANDGDLVDVSYKEGESSGNDSVSTNNYSLTVTELYLSDSNASNSGSVPNESEQYAEGTSVSLSTDFPNVGDNFHGYTLNADGSNPSQSLNITITENTTVYAVYDYEDQPNSALLNDLIAYYDMEEENGTTMNDQSSGNLDGTIHGATINQPGMAGKAYAFDGIDDYIEIPDASAFDLMKNFSISCWFKVEDVSQTQTIFGKLANADTHADPYFLYSTEATPASGEFVHITSRITVGGEDVTKTHYNQSTGVWHHLIYTFEGNNMRIYLDDSIMVSKYHPGDVDTNNLPIRIGANGGLSNFLQGQVDELGFWNKVLSDEERSELYNSGSGNAYPFDGSSGGATAQNYTLTVSESYLNHASSSNSGSVSPDSETYEEGTSVTVADYFTNDGSNFKGFFWDEDGTDSATSFSITQDTTVFAVYDSIAPASTLMDGLVSCWEFEETSGTVAADRVGNNNGIINGVNINQPGVLNQAYDFDGSGDYVNVGSDTSLDWDSIVTISIWVNFDVVNTWQGLYVREYERGQDGNAVYIKNNGKVYFKIAQNQSLEGLTTLSTNTWYHIVCVLNGTSRKIYLNGSVDISDSNGVTPDNKDANFSIGATINALDSGDSRDYTNGTIDQVAIWSRALTVNEIQELYNSGNGKAYPFNN